MTSGHVDTTLMRKNWHQLAIVLTLLIGAFLRFWNLTTLGLEHDEVANWLIDRSILAGKHGIYFQEAYGHEAGFHYLQTLFVALIGDNALALRLPAALLGTLLIAVSYTFVRVLYDRQVALIAALIVAVTFFPVFYSRLALRAIMLPVFSGLAGYFYWRGCKLQVASRKWGAVAGLFAGLSAYTYMASRVIPIFFIFVLIYQLIWQRRDIRFSLDVLLSYVVIAAPLYIYLALTPSADFRISEINLPLEQLRQLNVRPILENAWRILGVWGWQGDPLWRQNVAGIPIFPTWYIALLFYGGVLVMLWQRQPRDLFVLLWIATATIPSIVTIDAPSTIRMINMLPLLGVPVAVAHRLIVERLGSPRMWQFVLVLFLISMFARTTEMIFETWPQSEEVQFVWQQSLTNMADSLDEYIYLRNVTVIGWTPDTMDAPTMELALKRDDLALRFAGRDGGSVEAVAVSTEEDAAIFRPLTPQLPLHPALLPLLPSDISYDDFDWHKYRPAGNLSAENTPFDSQWQLLGNTPCEIDGNLCHFATVWQVAQVGAERQSVFVHVLDTTGEVLDQSDVQLNGRASWQVDDIVLVAHTVDITNSAEIRTGIYHPEPPYVRLQTPSGADSVQLTVITEQ